MNKKSKVIPIITIVAAALLVVFGIIIYDIVSVVGK